MQRLMGAFGILISSKLHISGLTEQIARETLSIWMVPGLRLKGDTSGDRGNRTDRNFDIEHSQAHARDRPAPSP